MTDTKKAWLFEDAVKDTNNIKKLEIIERLEEYYLKLMYECYDYALCMEY